MIRETGWDVRTYLEQPVADVFDLLQHMSENPPAHVILALRYLQPRSKRGRGGEAKARANSEAEVRELIQVMGGAAPIPAAVREMARWAEAEAKRAKGNHG